VILLYDEEERDDEDQYSPVPENKDISIKVNDLFLEIYNKKPKEEEKELLAKFIHFISLSGEEDISPFTIFDYLAEYAITRPKGNQEKREYAGLVFMHKLYSLMFSEEDPEAKDELFQETASCLVKAIPSFKGLEDDVFEEKVREYIDIVSFWYIRNYPKAPIRPVEVDKLPDEEKARITKRTLEMIVFINKSAEKGLIKDVEAHLHHLSERLKRFKY